MTNRFLQKSKGRTVHLLKQRSKIAKVSKARKSFGVLSKEKRPSANKWVAERRRRTESNDPSGPPPKAEQRKHIKPIDLNAVSMTQEKK